MSLFKATHGPRSHVLLLAVALSLPAGPALAQLSVESEYLPNNQPDPPSLFGDLAPEEAVPADEDVVFEVSFTEATVASAMAAFEDGVNLPMPDGSFEYLDLESLEDSFGRAYSVVGDSYQLSPAAQVEHTVRVLRRTRGYTTGAEVEAEYVAAHPGATAADLAELTALRARAATVSAPSRLEDGPAVLGWLAEAQPAHELRVRVRLNDPSPLNLPRPSAAMAEADPVSWLLAMEERQLAIEIRAIEVESRHWPIVQALPEGSWSEFRSGWVTDSFELLATPSAIVELASSPQVLRIEKVAEEHLAANIGDEIRYYSQLDQLVDSAGYDGGTPTGRNSQSRIYALIIDDPLDLDHPAWRDTSSSGSTRLVSNWLSQDGQGSTICPGTDWQLSTVGFQSGDSDHGNRVATQFLADLTDGQDASVTGIDRDRKTGATTETVFSSAERKNDQGNSVSWEDKAALAICLGVDIVNLSLGDGTNPCDIDTDESDAVNSMFHDGIFVVVAAGNEETTYYPDACTVRPPATAAGAFAVAGYEVQGVTDLDAAPLAEESPGNVSSSSGPDAYGRPLIKLTAAAGREGSHYAYFNNTYQASSGNGTSRAAPVVAGAAADVRDFMITTHGTGTGNEVGLLFAYLLAMGDGQLEGGGTQAATTPIDSAWGAGRMKVRRFDNAGMDYPWRRRWAYWTHDHGEVYTLELNPVSGNNTALSSDVEWFRGALWWFEPNIGSDGSGGLIDTSSVSYKISQVGGGYTYLCSSTVPQSQRLWLGNVVGGRTWETKVTGLSIPASVDPDYYSGLQRRKMFQVIYWEDRDRDDGDGPPADIE